ncbi:MAG: phasin family protein [Rhodospirillaceae bacterium]
MFKTYEDVISFNQANIDALVKSGTTLATGTEQVTKEAVSYISKAIEANVENAKALAACKTAAEALQLQQKFAKEAFEGAIAEANRLSEMGTVVSKSALEPIQARAKAAFSSVKAA